MERDREVLSGGGARSNYATDENLTKRQSICAYLDPQTTTAGAPIDRAPWRAGEEMLDIGCGNGLWLAAAWREARWAVGLDLSAGMLNAARATVSPAVPVLRADAQALPVATRAFNPDHSCLGAKRCRASRGGEFWGWIGVFGDAPDVLSV